MTVSQSNYLDFPNLYFSEVVGSVALGTIIGFVIIAYLHVKFRLPFESAMISSVLWFFFVVGYVYNAFLLMVAILVLGLAIFGMLVRLRR